MLIDLKVRHFKNSVFDYADHPLTKAMDEITNLTCDVSEDEIEVFKGGKLITTFEIVNSYLKEDYLKDKFKSLFYWNPEKVIRTVPLKEIR